MTGSGFLSRLLRNGTDRRVPPKPTIRVTRMTEDPGFRMKFSKAWLPDKPPYLRKAQVDKAIMTNSIRRRETLALVVRLRSGFDSLFADDILLDSAQDKRWNVDLYESLLFAEGPRFRALERIPIEKRQTRLGL